MYSIFLLGHPPVEEPAPATADTASSTSADGALSHRYPNSGISLVIDRFGY